MVRQVDRHAQNGVLAAIILIAAATIGVSVAAGRAEQLPQCVALARVVAAHEHSLHDGQRFRATEQQAYRVCAGNPAAFRKLIRVS
jgi:hypothetical protein